MFRQIRNQLYTFTRSIISSIAFYPTFISLGFLVLSMTLLTLENNEVTNLINEIAPTFVLNNAETARAILTTLVGGILSLTVFSFSMVMLLLSQASSNFSPRLLPGLISDKRNQIVLGIYLGTIIFNIIVLTSIHPNSDKYTLHGFSIVLGIILGIFCLGMFVYFIHTISTAIQISSILEKIFKQSKDRINELIEQERKEAETLDTTSDQWEVYQVEEAGYYQDSNLQSALEIVDDLEANLVIIPYKGEYLLPNTNLFAVDKKLDEDAISTIKNLFVFSGEQKADSNYVLGIRQITEVGIKAMSPGINDPGTAVITIDYLTELLSLRLKLDDKEVYESKDSSFKVELRTVDFSQILNQMMASYRQYCKHDFILMEKLILMLKYLRKQETIDESNYDAIEEQLAILKEDVENNMSNSHDRAALIELID
ncbi:DUF2254 domain-containing protein [Portibacter marinus]|uniref:DUF2254 domain-containing protein n=1 Tax=Portibacter marinus TaxID=2898660 RepID=UPI001F3B1CB6|nr:DUF2254 domain-containing protein [Portibacter marinus]